MAKMNYQKLSDYQYTHKPVITYSNSFSGSVIDRINKLLDVKKKPKKKAKPKAKAKRKPPVQEVKAARFDTLCRGYQIVRHILS